MINRKEFLQQLFGLTAGLAVPSLLPSVDVAEAASDPPGGQLPRRKLGSTGVDVPVLGLGGFHVGGAKHEKQARATIDAALEEGIRFIDTAESYQNGGSERWLGAGLKGVREQVFLMTKTLSPQDRSAESAKRHLEGSLERLQTDRLDLWQLHGIDTVEDVRHSFREGGAMQYILEMKEKSVVRYVGVTGHANPAAHRAALEYWDSGWKFDAMQFPLNPVDFHQLSFQHQLLPELLKRGIAVLAMKTSGGGALIQKEICSLDQCLRYVLSLPISVAIVGMETPEQVRHNANVVRTRPAFTAAEADALLERILPQVALNLEWYKRESG